VLAGEHPRSMVKVAVDGGHFFPYLFSHWMRLVELYLTHPLSCPRDP
jgi:hypothetical protein